MQILRLSLLKELDIFFTLVANDPNRMTMPESLTLYINGL